MNTILLTGASGYLATRLAAIACGYGNVVSVSRNRPSADSAADWRELDITNDQALRSAVRSIRPAVILHAAALNPGTGENDMDAVNHIAAASIARLASDIGARLVAVSSDVVLDGRQAPFADDAPASPLAGNEYARTKALGEAAILRHCPDAIVVRTSLIYGLQQMDRGTQGFVDRLERGEPLTLFTDVIRQPVWIDSLSVALCRLGFEFPHEWGIINVAGAEPISRAAFARKLLSCWYDAKDPLLAGADIREVSGSGIVGLPMDLRLHLTRALDLGLDLPGVSRIVENGA